MDDRQRKIEKAAQEAKESYQEVNDYMDFAYAQIYEDFAKLIGKDKKSLTTAERQQAILNHVLEQGSKVEA